MKKIEITEKQLISLMFWSSVGVSHSKGGSHRDIISIINEYKYLSSQINTPKFKTGNISHLKDKKMFMDDIEEILDKEVCEWMRKEGYAAGYAEMKKKDISEEIEKLLI